MFVYGCSHRIIMKDSDESSSASSSDVDGSSDPEYSSDGGLLSLLPFALSNYCYDDEEFYSTGDAYLIPTRALRLQKMASVRVAIELWNHAIDLLPELRPDEFDWKRSLWEKLIREWTLQLPLPKSFAGYIEDHFYDIILNIKDWITYHFSKVFWNQGNKSDLLPCLRYLIWHPNGSINYCETAQNLLKSDELGVIEKYRLACTYCLKEEVKKQWQALDGNRELNVVGVFENHPLYYYWNYYYIDNLDKIFKNNFSSVDELMIRQRDVDNWPAIEYFFDRMDGVQQVNSALYLIENDEFGYQNLILAKLDEFQRRLLYSGKGLQIIVNYARFGGADINDPNAISAWYEVRDLITPDEFIALMKALCRVSAADAVLTEIWTSAYDIFKRHVINSGFYYFIGDVLQWCYRKLENGYDFLVAVLAEETKPLGPPNFIRRRIISEVCEKLISDGEFESVTRLLNLCIPDAKECAILKEFWLKRS